MSLFQLEDQLKGLPDQRLVQEFSNPSGSVPQYMVIAELNRRKKMRAEAGASPQPETSVVDDMKAGIMGVGRGAPQMPPQGAPQKAAYADGGLVGGGYWSAPSWLSAAQQRPPMPVPRPGPEDYTRRILEQQATSLDLDYRQRAAARDALRQMDTGGYRPNVNWGPQSGNVPPSVGQYPMDQNDPDARDMLSGLADRSMSASPYVLNMENRNALQAPADVAGGFEVPSFGLPATPPAMADGAGLDAPISVPGVNDYGAPGVGRTLPGRLDLGAPSHLQSLRGDSWLGDRNMYEGEPVELMPPAAIPAASRSPMDTYTAAGDVDVDSLLRDPRTAGRPIINLPPWSEHFDDSAPVPPVENEHMPEVFADRMFTPEEYQRQHDILNDPRSKGVQVDAAKAYIKMYDANMLAKEAVMDAASGVGKLIDDVGAYFTESVGPVDETSTEATPFFGESPGYGQPEVPTAVSTTTDASGNEISSDTNAAPPSASSAAPSAKAGGIASLRGGGVGYGGSPGSYDAFFDRIADKIGFRPGSYEQAYDVIQQKIDAMAEGMEDRAEEDKWLALAQMGAAIAAGESPYFATNFGQGVASGVQALNAANARARKEEMEFLGLDMQMAQAREAAGRGDVSTAADLYSMAINESLTRAQIGASLAGSGAKTMGDQLGVLEGWKEPILKKLDEFRENPFALDFEISRIKPGFEELDEEQKAGVRRQYKEGLESSLARYESIEAKITGLPYGENPWAAAIRAERERRESGG